MVAEADVGATLAMATQFALGVAADHVHFRGRRCRPADVLDGVLRAGRSQA